MCAQLCKPTVSGNNASVRVASLQESVVLFSEELYLLIHHKQGTPSIFSFITNKEHPVRTKHCRPHYRGACVLATKSQATELEKKLCKTLKAGKRHRKLLDLTIGRKES